MVVRFEVGILPKLGLGDDDRALVGECHVSILVKTTKEVTRASVREILGLLPVDQIEIINTRVCTVLK